MQVQDEQRYHYSNRIKAYLADHLGHGFHQQNPVQLDRFYRHYMTQQMSPLQLNRKTRLSATG